MAEIDAAAEAAFAEQTATTGMGLLLMKADGTVVFDAVYGDFDMERRIGVASASKMVAGTVIFELLRRGVLDLDDTAGDVLGFPADKADITLRHLLSFTSGMTNEAGCILQAGMTLGECVDEIATLPMVTEPGVRFDYGSTHLQVAARMAEVKTGETWTELVEELLKGPLGIEDAGAGFYTAPRFPIGQQNPFIAGGLQITTRDYAKILLAVANNGLIEGGAQLGGPEQYLAQRSEPFPNAIIGNSPMERSGFPYHYGLAGWLECPPPAVECPVVSSPGAFGFTPWVDHANGYIGIVATLGTPNPGDAEGVVLFAVNLEHAVQPLAEQLVQFP